MPKLLTMLSLTLLACSLFGCSTMTLEEMYDNHQKKLAACPTEMAYTETTFYNKNNTDPNIPPTMIRQPLLNNGCPY